MNGGDEDDYYRAVKFILVFITNRSTFVDYQIRNILEKIVGFLDGVIEKGLLEYQQAFLVDLRGFEPLTFCMPCRRAPSCATGPYCHFTTT